MEYQPTRPAERCTAHDGAHAVYLGQCYAMGAQVKRPARFLGRPVYCQECGDELDVMKLDGGRVMLLTAGTDRRHYHPPREAPRVEIDEDSLAAAIVRASRAVRDDRRPEQRPASATPDAASMTRTPERPAAPDEPSTRTIPSVTVWSPGLDDGTSE